MKKIILSFLFVVAMTAMSIAAPSRQITNFDRNWYFHLGDVSGADQVNYNHKSWRSLNVPHDWSIEGENVQDAPGGGSIGYFPTGIGWYRKAFNIPGYNKNKEYSIEFDGVYMNSTVYVNGHELGTWPYGYSSFAYDLTPYLKASGNVIAVKVDNSQQTNSRWYTGSGIYRHVRIVETSATHFERWGVFNYTESLSSDEASIHVESSIVNDKSKAVNVTVLHELVNANGAVVASASAKVEVPANASASDVQRVKVANPIAWDLENPYLYTLRSRILEGKKEIDVVDNTVGIRTICYDLKKGFLLNGKQVKMKGVNLHHDGGAVGAAVPERVWERRIEILQSGGCNAIRTAHNAPAPEFLDLCDKMGMLVMDEAFDQWQSKKNDKDYHIYYDEWHDRDLRAMVARDRNHPSVVMWSVGNEIRDQSSPTGHLLAADLIKQCHDLDPTRLVTSGNDEIASNSPVTPEFLATFANDIVGYNYPDRWRSRRETLYAIDREEFPTRRQVATESSGMGGARRQYVLPGTEENRMGRKNVVKSLVRSEWIDVEQRWRYTLAYDYVIGDFMWTGIDYYGESRWPSRGSQSGYLDNCGFKKDGYYFFKSIWSESPVVHLLPHWNWEGNEGRIIQVVCFSNCDEVELFVNGKSYGKKSTEVPRKGVELSWSQYGPGKHFATTNDMHLTWDVEYQPGEIKAVGVKEGKTFVEVIRTAGKPAKLRATVDRPSFNANPTDVAHITVEVLDAEGNICPLSDNLVKFNVTGAELIGVESGNMSDLSSPKASERKAYSGLCLGIVSAKKAGKVSVSVSAEGLEGDTVVFEAK